MTPAPTEQPTPIDIAGAFENPGPGRDLAVRITTERPDDPGAFVVAMIPSIPFPGPSKIEGIPTVIVAAREDGEGKWSFVRDLTPETRQLIGMTMSATGCPTHVWHWATLYRPTRP